MAADSATHTANTTNALNDARDVLLTARDQAVEGGQPALAALLASAVRDLTHRRAQVNAAAAMLTWSLSRAADALEAAEIEARVDEERAVVVDLPAGQQLEVAPAAVSDTRDPQGYRLDLVAAGGVCALELRAGSDEELTATVERIVRQAR